MKNTLVTLVLLITFITFGQTKGKVTYKLVNEIDSLNKVLEKDKAAKLNPLFASMYDAEPIFSSLVFNGDKSTYYVNTKNIPKFSNSDGIISIEQDININRIMAGGDGICYNDFSRMFHIKQQKILDSTRRLIIKPSYSSSKWILKNETKVINGYNCKLAVREKLNNKFTKLWYTEEIPVKHGPYKFCGFPGLVVKIEDTVNTWTITSIDFKSEEADVIEELKEGKLITMDEYRKLAGNPFGKK